jgi:hypothetical protein
VGGLDFWVVRERLNADLSFVRDFWGRLSQERWMDQFAVGKSDPWGLSWVVVDSWFLLAEGGISHCIFGFSGWKTKWFRLRNRGNNVVI